MRVIFRVSRYFDVKSITVSAANERNEFRRVPELPCLRHPGWQVPAQGNQARDAMLPVFFKHRLEVVTFGRNAGNVWRHREAFVGNFKNRVTGTLLRRSAGAKSYGKEFRRKPGKALPHCAQLFSARLRLWWEKLKTQARSGIVSHSSTRRSQEKARCRVPSFRHSGQARCNWSPYPRMRAWQTSRISNDTVPACKDLPC